LKQIRCLVGSLNAFIEKNTYDSISQRFRTNLQLPLLFFPFFAVLF